MYSMAWSLGDNSRKEGTLRTHCAVINRIFAAVSHTSVFGKVEHGGGVIEEQEDGEDVVEEGEDGGEGGELSGRGNWMNGRGRGE